MLLDMILADFSLFFCGNFGSEFFFLILILVRGSDCGSGRCPYFCGGNTVLDVILADF